MSFSLVRSFTHRHLHCTLHRMYTLLPRDRQTCDVKCATCEKLLSPPLCMRVFTMDSLCKGKWDRLPNSYTLSPLATKFRHNSQDITIITIIIAEYLRTRKRTYTNESRGLRLSSNLSFSSFLTSLSPFLLILFVLPTRQNFSPNFVGAQVNKGRLNME